MTPELLREIVSATRYWVGVHSARAKDSSRTEVDRYYQAGIRDTERLFTYFLTDEAKAREWIERTKMEESQQGGGK